MKRHVSTLRELELITGRKEVLVRSQNAALIEVFEWKDQAAMKPFAHFASVSL